MTAQTIRTHFVYPPIPTRAYDWMATFGAYEPGNLVGYGSTEAEAIADLREQADEAQAKLDMPSR